MTVARAETAPAPMVDDGGGLHLELLDDELLDDELREPETGPELEPRRLTGIGNADRLLDRHGYNLRFCRGDWLVWDGQRWRWDEVGEVMERAKAAALGIDDEVGREPDEERRKALRAWAAKSQGDRPCRDMVTLASSDPRVRVAPDQLDANPWLLNVENGTVNLRDGLLWAQSRRDRITKLAPVVHDRAATCPTWEAFLARIFAGDAELVGFVQRALGYSLTGDTSEQVLFFLYGTGCNGKSTLLEVVRALLGGGRGGYAMQAPFSTFLERRPDAATNDLAELRGARFVAATEAREGQRLDEGVVKHLTGGDTVSARFLYREFIQFQPVAKYWLAANHKPIIRETNHAMWRRIRLIPFTVTIPDAERDPVLPAKLRAELPGILRWAVAGCLAWRQDGLGTPAAVLAATDAYRVEQDVLAAFLGDCCELGAEYTVEAGALYREYLAWSGGGKGAWSARTLGTKLRERGLEPFRTNASGRQWRGLRAMPHDVSTPHDVETPLRARVKESSRNRGVDTSCGMADSVGSGWPPPCDRCGGQLQHRLSGAWCCPTCVGATEDDPFTEPAEGAR